MSERLSLPVPSSATPSRFAGRAILRPQCACGSSATAGKGSCTDCERKKLQPKLVVGGAQDAEEHQADRVADAVMRNDAAAAAGVAPVAAQVQRSSADAGAASAGGAPAAPAIVDRVLAGAGQALEPGARRFFERRFGRDFSGVRVHADAQSAASARAVDAHAYTVGNHVVFGASRYAPDTHAGRRLLAHELTHVVQQGATLRRDSLSPELVGVGERDDDKPEGHPEGKRKDEADTPVQRLRRVPAIVGLDESGPKADLTGKREAEIWRLAERDKKLAECKKNAAPDPDNCKPAGGRPGWDQFTATPVATSSFGAMTFSSIQPVDVPSQKCEESITGSASAATKRFQGVLDPAQSWVKAKFANAGSPAQNGSAGHVTACEAFFDGLQPNQTGSWGLSTGAPAGCAAGARPRGDKAKKRGECATVVASDATDAAVAESMRLLNHEQTHLKLTCAMAKKGNALLAAGKTFAAINTVIHGKLATAQSQFDTQSGHGCNAGAQATWETAIANDLPAIVLLN